MISKPKTPNKLSRAFRIFLLLCLLTIIFPVATTAEESPWPDKCEVGSLPSGDPDYPEDQIILTCLPDLWNGFLVVYAHGYIAPQAPLALPVEELNQGSLPDGQTIIVANIGFENCQISRTMANCRTVHFRVTVAIAGIFTVSDTQREGMGTTVIKIGPLTMG